MITITYTIAPESIYTINGLGHHYTITIPGFAPILGWRRGDINAIHQHLQHILPRLTDRIQRAGFKNYTLEDS